MYVAKQLCASVYVVVVVVNLFQITPTCYTNSYIHYDITYIQNIWCNLMYTQYRLCACHKYFIKIDF